MFTLLKPDSICLELVDGHKIVLNVSQVESITEAVDEGCFYIVCKSGFTYLVRSSDSIHELSQAIFQ